MSMKEAIETAMMIEADIRDIYAKAFDACSDPVGRRFLAMMRDDEQYHFDYLSERLEELSASGKIKPTVIKTVVPAGPEIQNHLEALAETMAAEDRGVIQQMLSNALRVEVKTSQFYSDMVRKFDGEARRMFARFLEIEDAHIEAVQAELDYVMHTGYWFDFKEFDME